jgi:hypothetical protein
MATSGLNCPRKYFAEFFILSNDVENHFASQHIGTLNHTQPNGGFVQFLKNNTNLVNEISYTLCAAALHRSLAPATFPSAEFVRQCASQPEF